MFISWFGPVKSRDTYVTERDSSCYLHDIHVFIFLRIHFYATSYFESGSLISYYFLRNYLFFAQHYQRRLLGDVSRTIRVFNDCPSHL
jgi:hypothetical protein